MFLSDYMMQYKKMETNLCNSNTNNFEDFSYVEKRRVSASEQDQETEDVVISKSIENEGFKNKKSNNGPIFKKHESNKKY